MGGKLIFRLGCRSRGYPSGHCPWALIYIHDMPSQVSDGCLLEFAYDTCLICSGDPADAVANVTE